MRFKIFYSHQVNGIYYQHNVLKHLKINGLIQKSCKNFEAKDLPFIFSSLLPINETPHHISSKYYCYILASSEEEHRYNSIPWFLLTRTIFLSCHGMPTRAKLHKYEKLISLIGFITRVFRRR